MLYTSCVTDDAVTATVTDGRLAGVRGAGLGGCEHATAATGAADDGERH